MPTQVSLLDGALASAGTLAIQTNGTTSAITISSAQVATFVNNPIMTGLTASRAVFTDGSKGLTSNAITGTGNVVMSASPTLTGTIDGAALTLSSSLTLSGGTANGVLYLNGSKVATSGSALTFDGTNFATTGNIDSGSAKNIALNATSSSDTNRLQWKYQGTAYAWIERDNSTGGMAFTVQSAEGMRLTSTGLGIGTSSPSVKLHVSTSAAGIAEPVWLNNSQAVGAGVGSRLVFTGTTNNNGLAAIDGAFAGATTADGGYMVFNTRAVTSGALTERMRLDSSGNLGLGVTPSAWRSTYKALQTNGGSFYGFTSNDRVGMSQNAYVDATSFQWTYTTTAAATNSLQISGEHQWYRAASGTAGNAITFTQAMTLDASGNLGIGTTSPGVRLEVVSSSSQQFRVSADKTSSGIFEVQASTGLVSINANYWGATAAALSFQTNNTERARITSGGYFKASNAGTYYSSTGIYHEFRTNQDSWITINASTTSTAANCYGLKVWYPNATPNGTANPFIECSDGSADRFQVRSNGGIANYSANNVNLSDRREKTNFAPAGEYLSKICAIPVQTFNYIDQNLEEDAGLTLGVVAQDVQAVAPELVMESNWGTEEEPKMRLSIYQTDLQYALMKCIQEQQAIIEQLKARLDAANL